MIPTNCPTGGANWYHKHCNWIPAWKHRQDHTVESELFFRYFKHL